MKKKKTSFIIAVSIHYRYICKTLGNSPLSWETMRWIHNYETECIIDVWGFTEIFPLIFLVVFSFADIRLFSLAFFFQVLIEYLEVFPSTPKDKCHASGSTDFTWHISFVFSPEISIRTPQIFQSVLQSCCDKVEAFWLLREVELCSRIWCSAGFFVFGSCYAVAEREFVFGVRIK